MLDQRRALLRRPFRVTGPVYNVSHGKNVQCRCNTESAKGVSESDTGYRSG